MPSLKDLKNRIESVKSTRKITKAMQMVAAAKLRRAQEAAVSGRPYSDRFDSVMSGLTASMGVDSGPPLLIGTGSDTNHLLIVMTAERGLCGGFNSNIAKLAKLKASKLISEGKSVKILTVGKKGRDSLKREFGEYFVGHVDLTEMKGASYSYAVEVASNILNRFDNSEFDVATIYYSQFESVMSQIPTEKQLIPPVFQASTESTAYDYEPSEEEILIDLLPQSITAQIFRALLENGASEQGARMSAMDSATRNAGEMIDKLIIQYNRSRQAVITNELIEIISGAEAL
ncbi:MAG: F0F1 ATP synthase subunit gamma [Rhodobacteraceae bacterium]|nr:F0F1 ATP synthase subunit gamma [Paracoccaceae bacterium]